MDFIIHSTLTTIIGLSVIIGWLLVGYAVTRFYYLPKGKFQRNWKTIFGIMGGPVTLLVFVIAIDEF